MADNKPTYSLDAGAPRTSLFSESTTPSFWKETAANWRLGVGPQLFNYYMDEWNNTPDENFNPLKHIDGYEEHAGVLVRAQNYEQFNAIKATIDRNRRDRDISAQGEWGLISGLAAGIGDPINLIPIPGATGVGFVRGAVKAGATNLAVTAVTDPLRIAVDPTAEWSELQYSLTVSGLLGAGLGGAAGSLKLRGVRAAENRAALQRLVTELNELEGMNTARDFNANGENFARSFGHTGAYDETGAYDPVRVEDAAVPVRERVGPDGQTYFYDDAAGWINAADRGQPNPRPAMNDVLEQLGSPEMTTERRIMVDDVTLKYDYEQGKWAEDAPNGRKGIAKDAIRNANEYVTFRQLEAVWKRLLPRMENETVADYANRVQARALQELEGSRASAAVARAKGLETILDLGNRSPIAKAIRLFKNDNVLGDLPLALGGDYGWSIRANQAGIATTSSVLVRSLQHTAAFVELKQALDRAWTQYVTNSKTAQGVEFMGQNITGTAYAYRNAIRSATGTRVLTFDDFRRMAGRAVFDQGDFEVNGFKVTPEAREVAKAFTRIIQKYDAEARELGIFADQRSLKRSIATADKGIVRTKNRMATFLWGNAGEPQALQPAIMIDGQMFTGKSHEDALAAAMRALGPDVQIGPEAYGYVQKGADLPDPIPALKAGMTRLYRGEAPGSAGIYATPATGRWFTTDLKDAIDFSKTADGTVYYVDVSREDMAGLASAAANPDKWFVVSDDIANRKSYFSGKNPAGDDPTIRKPKARFQTQDDLIKARRDSLSAKQLEAYELLEGELLEHQMTRSKAEAELATMTETHQFRDQFGNPEPYFARFWNKPMIQANRVKFERLLTAWYNRDNPVGARERAAETIDRLTTQADNADEAPMGGGLRHLNRRTLNIPNTFKITDPEFGELSVADFIETDIEAVTDVYVRKMGTRIEMAKMFGDINLTDKKAEIREYFFDRYIEPALKKGDDIGPIRDQMNEYMNYVDTIRDDVLGNLKTRDPWAVDNRVARFLRNTASLAMMGRVLITALPEAMRAPMVNGFGTAFRSLFVRAFADFEQIKGNAEFMKLTGEISDMVRNQAFARIAENNSTDVRGGTWIERELEKVMPGFYKLVGLTPWTQMAKDWAMFSSQHKIMADALEVADAVTKGAEPPAQTVQNLSALGISLRDAVLLSKMPYERLDDGLLILPSVDKWTGGEGQRARQLFLDAMIGTARRTIITPSMADLPLAARGVLTWRGRKVMESDLLTMPFQFLSYGLAASQKLMMSALQGRDANAVGGVAAMLLMGGLSVYLKTPENAWRNKSYEDILIESYEAAGLGGFWFSDLNQQIELFSRHQIGLRPALGLDPRFGKEADAGAYIDALGRGPGMYYDVIRAFWDDSLSATNRAQMIRRAIPFNNVIWWGGLTRDLATASGRAAEQLGN